MPHKDGFEEPWETAVALLLTQLLLAVPVLLSSALMPCISLHLSRCPQTAFALCPWERCSGDQDPHPAHTPGPDPRSAPCTQGVSYQEQDVPHLLSSLSSQSSTRHLAHPGGLGKDP